MKSVFSNEGRQRLDDIVGNGSLCAFDFDGTLAPIVSVPEQARLPQDILRRLTALREYAPVAIITGRSVDDISGRLGFAPDFIVGNHGLEGLPGWEAQAAHHRAPCSGWRAQLADALHAHGLDSGIRIEDKRYSLSVHYRHARDPELAAHSLHELFMHLVPRPRVMPGKYVFNLLAEGACHKGSALEQLMTICCARGAVYVGDDVTDEDVFRLARPDLMSIRIERDAGSAAAFFLPHPRGILSLLEELTARLRAVGARNWVQAGTVSTILSTPVTTKQTPHENT